MNKLPITAIAVFLFLSIFYLQWRRHYFKRIPAHDKLINSRFYISPFACFTALTVLTAFIDPSLRIAIQKIQHPLLIGLIHLGGWLGQGTNLWFVLSIIYLFFLTLQRPTSCDNTFGCILSAGLASLLCTSLKLIFLRARPYSNFGHLSFLNWPGLIHHKSAFQSFPSGDTAIVSAVAFYLFYRLRKFYLSPAVLIFPLATALSRVFLNRHWPSDTIFAMGLGLVSAQLIFQYENLPPKSSGMAKNHN